MTFNSTDPPVTYASIREIYASIPLGEIRDITPERRMQMELALEALAEGFGFVRVPFGYAEPDREPEEPKPNWSAEGF